VKTDQTERKAHIIGWLLFIICALFFLASGIVNKDVLTLWGSLIFLLACLVFLYPLLYPNEQIRKQDKQNQNIP